MYKKKNTEYLNMSLRSFFIMEMLKILCAMYATGWNEMTLSSDNVVCQCYIPFGDVKAAGVSILC